MKRMENPGVCRRQKTRKEESTLTAAPRHTFVGDLETALGSMRVLSPLGNSRMIAILVLLIVLGYKVSPEFLSVSNLDNLLRLVTINGILAIGETFVLLGGEVDLSVGSIMLLSLVIGGKLLFMGAVPAMIITLVSGALLGAVNGVGVVVGKIRSVIMTLSMLFFGRGVAYIVSGGQGIYLWKYPQYLWIGRGHLLGIPLPILLFGTAIMVSWFLLSRTVIGYNIYAIGANPKASWWSGIEVGRWKILTFVLAGLCSAFAGVIESGRLGVIHPSQGNGREMWAIAVAILGGTRLDGGEGGIPGTLVGALIVAMVVNLLNLLGVNVYLRNMLLGTIIIASALKSSLQGTRTR